MAPGGIYTKCEEPDTVELKDNMSDKTSRRAGGFLSQCCRCCSEGTSISVLYIANVALFLLWIITISILSAKYSKMAEEVEQLHGNQTQLRANDTHMEKQLEIFQSTYSTYASNMNNSLKTLKDNHTKLRDDVTKELHDLQTEKLNIWTEMYKVEDALHSLNASGCKMCPDGWLLNRGQCYYFNGKSMTWSSARKFCQDQGGDLVVINDDDEQMFLQKNKNPSAYWIGLHDMKSETNFVWVDGSSLSYTYWSAGEPNDYGHGEDCVQMEPRGRWNDFGCAKTVKGSICEKTWNCQ